MANGIVPVIKSWKESWSSQGSAPATYHCSWQWRLLWLYWGPLGLWSLNLWWERGNPSPPRREMPQNNVRMPHVACMYLGPMPVCPGMLCLLNFPMPIWSFLTLMGRLPQETGDAYHVFRADSSACPSHCTWNSHRSTQFLRRRQQKRHNAKPGKMPLVKDF